jgi:hypothetical protein
MHGRDSTEKGNEKYQLLRAEAHLPKMTVATPKKKMSGQYFWIKI